MNASLTNEFATVGYRAHSMIHGEIEMETDAARYSPEQLAAFEREGIELELSEDGTEIEIAVPLNVAFFNPELVGQLQLGPLLQGIGLEAQYKNDEQIDNQLRSVLFQIPVPGNPHCLDGPTLPECFRGVVDLGAIDVERGRDHGMPSYNQLRRAYGLDAEALVPGDHRRVDRGVPGRSRADAGRRDQRSGQPGLRGRSSTLTATWSTLDAEEAGALPVRGVRRTTLAARLKAIYGSVNNVDAFTGMVAERHVPGTEFGELQLAIWKKQFEALRDGDRFFYRNDPGLSLIRAVPGHRLPAQPGRHHRPQHRHPPRRAGRERLPDPARGGGDRRRRRRHREWYDRPGSSGANVVGSRCCTGCHTRAGIWVGRPAPGRRQPSRRHGSR